jgi:hypothetical protein
MTTFENKALLYAEKHGIIDYVTKGSKMVYSEYFYGEGTYQCTVDLNTMKEKRVLN